MEERVAMQESAMRTEETSSTETNNTLVTTDDNECVPNVSTSPPINPVTPPHQLSEDKDGYSEEGSEEAYENKEPSGRMNPMNETASNVLAPSKLNPFQVSNGRHSQNPFGPIPAQSSAPHRIALRPSALDKQTVNFKTNVQESSYRSEFQLAPALIQSPLHGVRKEASKENLNSESQPTDPFDGRRDDRRTTENYFAQFGGGATAMANKPETKYLFGEGLSERVNVAAPGKNSHDDSDGSADSTEPRENKTLAESAAEHEAKLTKPVYDEVTTKTGEEEESNVFQFNAKLFQFEKDTQSWLEKGRGFLRLNDLNTGNSNLQSRLIMRTHGILRVVLNTNVWPGMTVERASPKSVRVSAFDSDDNTIKIFLIMANPSEIDQILKALEWRIQQLQPAQSESCLKRKSSPENDSPSKKTRSYSPADSNDASTVEPETESSLESLPSSTTVKSTSSD